MQAVAVDAVWLLCDGWTNGLRQHFNNVIVPFLQMMSSNASIIPTPAQAAGVTAGSTTVPEELDLFNESNSTTKTDNTVKQPLSKDSILSLYGTHSISHSTSPGKNETFSISCLISAVIYLHINHIHPCSVGCLRWAHRGAVQVEEPRLQVYSWVVKLTHSH